MRNSQIQSELSSPEVTTEAAKRLAVRLSPGDTVLLTGDIGAGKTHFARSVIQSLLEVPEDVPSPTFTLVQIYEVHQFEIWHADLYRLSSPDEVIELGLLDAFQDAVCLVEWPDRLAELAPCDALSLTFTACDEPGVRNVQIDWNDERWSAKVEGVFRD